MLTNRLHLAMIGHGSSRNGPRKSNITDNESATMKTSHGVIQGYNSVAMVDNKHQIVVHAEVTYV